MKDAKSLTIYFMQKKNDIIFNKTGLILTSNDDLNELLSWGDSQYNAFMNRLMKKRGKMLTPEEKAECNMCFGDSFCSSQCPIDRQVIDDSDICPWCVNHISCGDCWYGARNKICSKSHSKYQEIRYYINSNYLVNFTIPKVNNGVISCIPEIIDLFNRTVYDWLTGEELIESYYESK